MAPTATPPATPTTGRAPMLHRNNAGASVSGDAGASATDHGGHAALQQWPRHWPDHGPLM
jgi:hypothetical protein